MGTTIRRLRSVFAGMTKMPEASLPRKSENEVSCGNGDFGKFIVKPLRNDYFRAEVTCRLNPESTAV